jgi:hypothetical protein
MDQTQYAYWRTDKPKEAGFTHELISNDFKNMTSKYTTEDELCNWPFQDEKNEGVRTLYEALQRNLARIPHHPCMGTKRGD